MTAQNKSLLTLGKMKRGDVDIDGVDEWEPMRLLQVRATAIQGTEELWHWTWFK